MSCEPTYEELKDRNALLGCVEAYSCEPTYEELKVRAVSLS